jgi:hypothetical protein
MLCITLAKNAPLKTLTACAGRLSGGEPAKNRTFDTNLSSVKVVQLGGLPNLENLIVSSTGWFKKKKSPKSVVRDHQKGAII